MIDTYPIKSPFTLIYLFLLLIFFFLNHTFCFTLTLIFSHQPASSFSSFKIFIFSHMKLLAQLPCLLSFFTTFFSNSIRLFLDFPNINPVRLPQKNFMFSHMFLWVFSRCTCQDICDSFVRNICHYFMLLANLLTKRTLLVFGQM